MLLLNLQLGNRLGSYLSKSLAVSFAIGVIMLGANVGLSQTGSRFIVPTTQKNQQTLKNQETPKVEKIVKTDSQWRKMLTREEYEVTRNKGTEEPFTGKLLKNKKEGVYVCKCCGHALFDSKHKYESQTGWPSYFAPKNSLAVQEIADLSHQMVRTEVICRRCDAHLGHVFNDGPRPTGLRYCMNSVSLKFVDREKWNQQQKELAEKEARKAESKVGNPESPSSRLETGRTSNRPDFTNSGKN